MTTKNRVNIVLYLLLLSVYMYTYLGMLWELETLKLKIMDSFLFASYFILWKCHNYLTSLLIIFEITFKRR